MVGFGAKEQELLMQTCQERNVPYQLVSTLLNLEFEHQGGKKHAKIFAEIGKELKKEWRDTKDKKVLKEILGELSKDKKILNEAKGESKEDTEEKLIEKIKNEMKGENRPPVINDYVKKLLKIYEEQIEVEKKEKNGEQILELQNKIEKLKNEDYWWNDE